MNFTQCLTLVCLTLLWVVCSLKRCLSYKQTACSRGVGVLFCPEHVLHQRCVLALLGLSHANCFGCFDCEAICRVSVLQDVTVVNRSAETLQNLCLELATMGDLKLVERPQNYTLAPGDTKVIRANIKVRLACLLRDSSRTHESPKQTVVSVEIRCVAEPSTSVEGAAPTKAHISRERECPSMYPEQLADRARLAARQSALVSLGFRSQLAW